MISAMTGFGAPWDSPARSAAVLRAQAAAAGVALRPGDDIDLAAAVVGGHAWTLGARRTNLHHGCGLPTPLIAAAAAVLARAAGNGTVMDPVSVFAQLIDSEPLACPAPLMRAATVALDWARSELDDDAALAAALTRAGVDLLIAGRHDVAALGWALIGEAEGLLLDC